MGIFDRAEDLLSPDAAPDSDSDPEPEEADDPPDPPDPLTAPTESGHS